MKKKNTEIRSNRFELVSEYYLSGESIPAFCLKKSIPRSTFSRWIRNFESSNQEMAEVMKRKSSQKSVESPDEVSALKSELARLQGELKREKLRAHAYDTMIDVAEEMFNIPIRKKAGTKQ